MINAVILDGDEMRESISFGAGFSRADREAHNLRVARLANVLSRRSPVIVSVIAPFEQTRIQIDEMIKPVWIYIKRNSPINADKPYEAPSNAHINLDSDLQTTEEQVGLVLKYIRNN